jgi:uncharacterized protein (DUF2141 family)
MNFTRSRSFRFRWRVSAAGTVVPLLLGVSAHAEVGGPALIVEIEGMQSDHGEVIAAVYRNGEDYRDSREPVAYDYLRIAEQRARWTVSGLAAGTYVVMVYHDLNGNRRLDKNLFGFPVEPYGISNGVRAVFGPPPFDKARVFVNGEAQSLRIRVE